MAVISSQAMMLISAMLITAGALSLQENMRILNHNKFDDGHDGLKKFDDGHDGEKKWTEGEGSETFQTGLFYQGQPIALGRVATRSTSGNESWMVVGPKQTAIYDVSDEPFKFAKLDGGDKVDGNTTAFAAAKCTEAVGKELAAKYPAKDVPKAVGKSALPEGSFYSKLQASKMGCTGNVCQVPSYLPASQAATTDQKIPRIVFMTLPTKMMTPGPFQYNLIAKWIEMNPEYEFVFSDDSQSDAFMASKEVAPEHGAIYKKARNGAEKADIWRYAAMYKYGGVYMDSDMTSMKPLHEIIDSKADVVQAATMKGNGKDNRREPSQFALFFAPQHKVMKDALDGIAKEMALPAWTTSLTIRLTGPGALSRIYLNHAEFGVTACKGDHPNHMCGKPTPTETGEFGKVVFLDGARDFNTGVRWHKVDTCALSEGRSNNVLTRWTAGGAGTGGGKKKKR